MPLWYFLSPCVPYSISSVKAQYISDHNGCFISVASLILVLWRQISFLRRPCCISLFGSVSDVYPVKKHALHNLIHNKMNELAIRTYPTPPPPPPPPQLQMLESSYYIHKATFDLIKLEVPRYFMELIGYMEKCYLIWINVLKYLCA